MTTDDEAASAPAAPAPPVAANANDDDSSDDDPYADNDDDDSEDDPFANLSRFQSDRRRKLQQTTYSSEEDSDDDSDSGSKKPLAAKSIAVASAVDTKRNCSTEKPSLSTSSPSSGNKRKATATSTMTAADDDCCEVISSSSSTFSDDDNIDIEIENIAKNIKSAATSSASAATTAQKRTTRRSARLQPPEDTRDPSVRAASNAALEEARRAREALKAAQSYRAKQEEEEEEEDFMEVVSPPPTPHPNLTFSQQTSSVVAKTAAAAPPPAIHFSGATLRLTFRYRHPTTKKDCTTNVKLKSDQPFQYAVEEFEMTHRGQKVGLKIVGAMFDGRKLDMTKPPTLYDMEDEDLVDVDVLIDENPASSLVRMPPTPKTAVVAAAPAFYGATLRLTFRYQHPTTKKDCTTNIKLKSDQPLQYAVIEFEMQHRGSGLRISSAIFDGRKLDMSKTPALYDMEDEDLVDVVVNVVTASSSAPALAGAATVAAPSAARLHPSALAPFRPATIYSGANLRLAFRYQHPTLKRECCTTIKLKSDQPLQHAVIEFEVNHAHKFRIASAVFDGRKLDMCQTPKSYDMDDEDLIDVSVIEPNATPLPQYRSIPGSVHAAALVIPRAVGVGGAAQGAKITVRFRINGNSSDIASYTQDPKNMFALQMNLMCRTRGIVPEQCTWKYGGGALCPRTTPESLGITSGEMIVDVAISSSKAATSRAAQRAAKAITAAGRCIGRRGRR